MSLTQRIRSATKIFSHKPTKEKSSEDLSVKNAAPAPAPAAAQPVARPSSPGPVLGPPGQVFKKCIDPHATEVPKIIRSCVEFIERAGTNVQGIFRLSGSHEELQELVTRFDCGVDVDVSKYDPLVVAALLKRYLRDMPEPLITYEWYDALLASVGIKDHDAQLNEVKKVMAFLPEGNKLVLAYLLSFLHRFVQYEKVTLMSSQNLSIVFSPNILRAQNMTIEEEIQDSVYTNALVMFLIEKYPLVFAEYIQQHPEMAAKMNPPPNPSGSGLKRESSGGIPPAIPPKPTMTRATSAGSLASPKAPPKVAPKPISPKTPEQINVVRAHRSSTSSPTPAFKANSAPLVNTASAPHLPPKPALKSPPGSPAPETATSPPAVKRPTPVRTVIAVHTRSQSADVVASPFKKPPLAPSPEVAAGPPPARPTPPKSFAPPPTTPEAIAKRPLTKPPEHLVQRTLPAPPAAEETPQDFAPVAAVKKAPPGRFRAASRHTFAPGSISPSFMEEHNQQQERGPPPVLPRKLSSTNPFLPRGGAAPAPMTQTDAL